MKNFTQKEISHSIEGLYALEDSLDKEISYLIEGLYALEDSLDKDLEFAIANQTDNFEKTQQYILETKVLREKLTHYIV